MFEGRNFLLMCGLGVVYFVIYDIFRILRYAIPHNVVALSVEDMLFFIMMGFSSYIIFLYIADGRVRMYMIAGIAVGIAAYRSTISRFLVPFCGKLLKKALIFCTKTVKIRINKLTRGGKGEEGV